MAQHKSNMTKGDLINEIADRTGFSRAIVRTILDEFFQVVKESILNNFTVQIRGFGSFFRKQKASKRARNIAKNTSITIPAHEAPAFKPSKEFRDCLK
jgi:DNA-binding protein HU-beta